jgi:enterochelin esterase family protein
MVALMLVCAGVAPAADPAAGPLSPRMVRLEERLKAGNRAALDAFWADVTKAGTPLVEPVPGDDRHALVTFVWRGKDGDRTVAVQIGMGRGRVDRSQLRRVPGTDLWYRTERLRADARCCYQFAVNDGPGPIEDAPRGDFVTRITALRKDPLNPRFEPLGVRASASVLELPDAPPQPWVKKNPATPAGDVASREVKSRRLGRSVAVKVYTPVGHARNGKRYGLLVLFDGPTYNLLVPTPTILDNLIADGKVAPLVCVFVTHVDRMKELDRNKPFTDFLAEELVPWARKEFHATDDPRQTVVAGSSLGGLAAAFAAYTHPTVFGNVLSQSGAYSFAWDGEGEPVEMGRLFASAPKLSVRFYMDAGLMETALPMMNRGVSLLSANRHVRDVLRAKGYELHYREFNGGHEYLNWRGTLADGLIALVGTDGGAATPSK